MPGGSLLTALPLVSCARYRCPPDSTSMRRWVLVSLSSGYHPQTNGQTEWANQHLESTLRCVVVADLSSWFTHLPWGEYAHNAHTWAATGLSPFEASLGYLLPCSHPRRKKLLFPLYNITLGTADEFGRSRDRPCSTPLNKMRGSPIVTASQRPNIKKDKWSGRPATIPLQTTSWKPRFIGPTICKVVGLCFCGLPLFNKSVNVLLDPAF